MLCSNFDTGYNTGHACCQHACQHEVFGFPGPLNTDFLEPHFELKIEPACISGVTPLID